MGIFLNSKNLIWKQVGKTNVCFVIISILDGFVNIANDIRNGNYDCYGKYYDIKIALEDFKDRYRKKVMASYNIMLEDWFLILELFFLKNNIKIKRLLFKDLKD